MPFCQPAVCLVLGHSGAQGGTLAGLGPLSCFNSKGATELYKTAEGRKEDNACRIMIFKAWTDFLQIQHVEQDPWTTCTHKTKPCGERTRKPGSTLVAAGSDSREQILQWPSSDCNNLWETNCFIIRMTSHQPRHCARCRHMDSEKAAILILPSGSWNWITRVDPRDGVISHVQRKNRTGSLHFSIRRTHLKTAAPIGCQSHRPTGPAYNTGPAAVFAGSSQVNCTSAVP